MHLNRLDLNLLVALNALLTEQNVTRAAERVHISQPAMSGALQRLRAHLNDPLLESVGQRRLNLTPRARRLVGPVRELLLKIQSTLSDGPEFDPLTAAHCFQLSMSSYCAQLLGSRLIADLRHNAPSIKCRLHELSLDSLAQVAEGDLDFCVTLSDYSDLDPPRKLDLRAEPAFRDRFVMVAAAHNTEVAKSLTADKYRALPSVEVRLFGDTLSIGNRLLQSFEKPTNTVAVVSSFHLAMAAVSGTSMVSIVPAMLARSMARQFDLKSYELGFATAPINESLIWHSRSDADPAYIWLRQRLLLVAAALQNADRPHSLEIAKSA